MWLKHYGLCSMEVKVSISVDELQAACDRQVGIKSAARSRGRLPISTALVPRRPKYVLSV